MNEQSITTDSREELRRLLARPLRCEHHSVVRVADVQRILDEDDARSRRVRIGPAVIAPNSHDAVPAECPNCDCRRCMGREVRDDCAVPCPSDERTGRVLTAEQIRSVVVSELAEYGIRGGAPVADRITAVLFGPQGASRVR